MRATLSFNLPEEQESWEVHSKAMDMHFAIWDFAQKLRQWNKYERPAEWKTPEDALEAIRELLYQELNERGVSL